MKKIYLLVAVCISLSTGSMAQAGCPNPGGVAFPFQYSGGCYVFVTGTLPNADISVFSGLNRINETEGQTAADGTGTVFFTCGQTITNVTMTLPDGTVCNITNIAALATLPVKLNSFNARLKDANTVGLQWVSEFELDSYQYLVQRSSDGRNFTTIGEVAAAGNAQHTISYDYDDAQAGNGVAYYRLKMIDIDGSFDYSKVVYVNKGATTTLSIFPNPFRSEIQLVGITTGDVNRKKIRLYDMTGKEVNYIVTGANQITVDRNATPGVYILKVQGQGRGQQVYKLIKE